MDKKGKNKMMTSDEVKNKNSKPKKGYHFPAQNGRKAIYIEASSLEEANDIYEQISKK